MRQGFKGFLVGVGLTLSITVSAAYALGPEFENTKNELTDGLIYEVNELVNNYCEVYINYGRRTFGDRCYRGEVMTGRDGEYIICSDISVECFSKKKVHSFKK